MSRLNRGIPRSNDYARPLLRTRRENICVIALRSSPRDSPFRYSLVTSRGRTTSRTILGGAKASRAWKIYRDYFAAFAERVSGIAGTWPSYQSGGEAKGASGERHGPRVVFILPSCSPPFSHLARHVLAPKATTGRRSTGRGSRARWIIKRRFPRSLVLGCRRLINYLPIPMMQPPPARWLSDLLAHLPAARVPNEAASCTCASSLQGDYPDARTLLCGVSLKIVSVFLR